jgi:hypothetical protein
MVFPAVAAAATVKQSVMLPLLPVRKTPMLCRMLGAAAAVAQKPPEPGHISPAC